MKQILLISVAVFASQAIHALAVERPNIILVFADDISARELPLYESSVWSKPTGGNTTDKSLRANTPVLDQMAAEGCWVKTAWASVVCSPSRAMMMTGRYAHRHKWWNNKDKGQYINESGKQVRDDHGSVIRTEVDFDDIDITFDFRFSGGKSFNFVIDDKQEKSVHAGHICRVSIFPGSLIIGDDKRAA